MKKNIVKICIAFIVLLILVAGTILLRVYPNTKNNEFVSSETDVYTIYEESEENVNRISINGTDSRLEFTKNKDGMWNINNVSDTDQYKVKTLVDTVLRFVSTEIIDESPTNLKQYGLDEPDISIVIDKNFGDSDMISIGKKSPVNDFFFVKVTDTVYALNADIVEIITKPISYYTEYSRFDIEDISVINAVTIKRDDMTISVAKGEKNAKSPYDSWKLTSPITADADTDYISNTILEGISNICLSQPVLDGDFGFDNSPILLIINMDSPNDQECRENIIIGNKSEGNVYVSYKDKVYAVPLQHLDFVNMPLINFVMKTQAIVNMREVSSVEMIYGSHVNTLEISHSDVGEIFNLNGKRIGEGDAKQLYRELIGIPIDGIYEGEKLGECMMEIKYKGYGGAENIDIELKAINDLECALVKNGEKQFTVSKTVVVDLMDKVNGYIK